MKRRFGRRLAGRLRWILGLGLLAVCRSVSALQVSLPLDFLPPGGTVVCRVGGLVPEGLTLAGFSQEAGFYFSKADGLWVALLAVPLAAPPGPSDLELRWPGGSQSLSLRVAPDPYPRLSELRIRGLRRRLSRSKTSGDGRLLRLREAGVVPQPLWHGRFQWPLQGSITVTSPFGERRDYNHGQAAWQHQGVDLRAGRGTPVLAANDGVVVLARRRMALTGGTVVLDHGYGLTTAYFHLGSVRVRVGQKVPKGGVLGISGSSGLSLGPHLHFEMRLRGLAVAPAQWVQASGPEFPGLDEDSSRNSARRPI